MHNNMAKATLVTEVSDIISALAPILGRPLVLPVEEPENGGDDAPEDAAPDERRSILGLLGPTPVDIDDLIRLSGARPAAVRMVLLELEIAGKLERQAGGRVALL